MDVGHQVPVRNSYVIQSPVVATGPPTPIPLRHHVQGAGPGGVGPMDDAGILHLLKLGPGDGKLVRVQPAGLGKDGLAPRVDMVLNPMCWLEVRKTRSDDVWELCQKVPDHVRFSSLQVTFCHSSNLSVF